MEKAIEYNLEDFSGPLDLLLTLIAKNKMSIYDFEILTIINQYLAAVGGWHFNDLESASEFITMASDLVHKKSRLLLPKSEDTERVREELTGLLVEYSACKEVAGLLREMAAGVFVAVRKPVHIEFDSTYEGHHNRLELSKAWSGMAGRKKATARPRQEQFEEIVAAPFVSVGARAIHLLRGLVAGKINRLRQIFAATRSRSETVATFLALLELISRGRITIAEDEQVQLHERHHTGERDAKNPAPEEAAGGA